MKVSKWRRKREIDGMEGGSCSWLRVGVEETHDFGIGEGFGVW